MVEGRPVDDGVAVTLMTADGPVHRRDDAVVVATGTAWDRRALGMSPLWASLLERGQAAPHPSGIGVRTDPDGRLIDVGGDVVPGVICLGAIRQGELWETTAIPEIRQQAAAAAELLAAADSPPTAQPAPAMASAPPRFTR